MLRLQLILSGMASMATFIGTSGNNTLNGTDGPDILRGLAGNDYLNGRGGNDDLAGGEDNDTVDGGAGNDVVRGGGGVDFVVGGTGDDQLFGDDGDDYLWDTAGFDSLFGGNGNDRLLGGEGRNNLSGDAGNDTLVVQQYSQVTGNTDSVFSGGSGHDTLHGIVDALIDRDPGADPPWLDDATFRVDFSRTTPGSGVFGFADRDTNWVENYQYRQGGTFSSIERVTVDRGTVLEYVGGVSNVTAIGNDQHDFFIGGSGNETLVGGGDEDLFHFGGIRPHGTDRIVGFNPGEGDIVSFSWGTEGVYNTPVDMEIVERDGHTIITSSRQDGTVFHVLDIDAVDIPSASIMPDWIWT